VRSEMREQPLPKPWIKRLQLSLRTLMFLVLVLGTGLGWIVHRAHRQRRCRGRNSKSRWKGAV